MSRFPTPTANYTSLARGAGATRFIGGTVMDGEPLIYTTKGNLPVASLRCVTKREDVPGTVVLVKEWHLGDELVRRDVDVCPLVGACAESVQGSIG